LAAAAAACGKWVLVLAAAVLECGKWVEWVECAVAEASVAAEGNTTYPRTRFLDC
jgi:hypothetical protein